jgi:membrane-associated phospholipid phosphatase
MESPGVALWLNRLEGIQMTRTFVAWFASLLTIVLTTLILVRWLDKPIALWVHSVFGSPRRAGELASAPVFSIPLILAVAFVVLGLLAIMGRRFSKLKATVLLCNISMLAADAIKNQLKFAFGRTWPDSWKPGVVSLVHDNAYGFHFFQSGLSFESFPSGHAAVAAATLSVLWILYPRLRAVWGIGIVAAAFGLVALNLHFLSDVMVGSFVGVSTGLFTVALWRASCRQLQLFGSALAAPDLDRIR